MKNIPAVAQASASQRNPAKADRTLVRADTAVLPASKGIQARFAATTAERQSLPSEPLKSAVAPAGIYIVNRFS